MGKRAWGNGIEEREKCGRRDKWKWNSEKREREKGVTYHGKWNRGNGTEKWNRDKYCRTSMIKKRVARGERGNKSQKPRTGMPYRGFN